MVFKAIQGLSLTLLFTLSVEAGRTGHNSSDIFGDFEANNRISAVCHGGCACQCDDSEGNTRTISGDNCANGEDAAEGATASCTDQDGNESHLTEQTCDTRAVCSSCTDENCYSWDPDVRWTPEQNP